MDVLQQICDQEAHMGTRHFVAPAAGRGLVRLEHEGLVLALPLRRQFHGWGVFSVSRLGEAVLVRHAEAWERDDNGARWPRRRMILLQPHKKRWLALSRGGTALLPVELVPSALQAFDCIDAVSDGTTLWYWDQPGVDAAAYSRRLRDGDMPPHLRGLAAETAEARVRRVLERTGATVFSVTPVSRGMLRVHWRFRGHEYHTEVRDHDLSVVSAGLCLAGHDEDYDLHAMPGVLANP